MLLRLVEGVGDRGLGILRLPLLGAGGALRQLPLELEQVLEEEVAPLRRRLRPSNLRTASDGVGTDAGAVLALPAQTLVFDRAAFRLDADERGIARAVRLAEGVPACDQRDGLLVVHRHAREGLADVARRGDRIGIAVRAFGVHVDQAHLHGAQRIGQLALSAITLVAKPGALGTPVEFLRFPGVSASAGKAEGLEAHRLERDVAHEDIEIGPGNLAAVLLLDRPQQAAGFVQIGVVGPAIERCEALLSAARAAAAIGNAVSAGAVPREADEQAAVVTKISRPPVLRIRHESVQILDHCIEIEALEFLGVVEALAHRVRGGCMLLQDLEIQPIRPPFLVIRA